MKLTKFLSILSLVLFSYSLTSCNKEARPVVFTGMWEIDTASTFVQFIFDPDLQYQYPNTMQYVKDNIYDIKDKISVPNRIEFVVPNTVIFYYDDAGIPPVEGTYTQYDAYVTIINDIFPLGIIAGSNNVKLEIYYEREYMLNQIYSMLTPEDDPQEYFSYLFTSINGVAVYTH